MNKNFHIVDVEGHLKTATKEMLNVTGKARMWRGTPLRDEPCTYKKVGVLYHSLGNNYNPHIMDIFKAKDGTFRYSIYRDGCFYPYYGKIQFLIRKNNE